MDPASDSSPTHHPPHSSSGSSSPPLPRPPSSNIHPIQQPASLSTTLSSAACSVSSGAPPIAALSTRETSPDCLLRGPRIVHSTDTASSSASFSPLAAAASPSPFASCIDQQPTSPSNNADAPRPDEMERAAFDSRPNQIIRSGKNSSSSSSASSIQSDRHPFACQPGAWGSGEETGGYGIGGGGRRQGRQHHKTSMGRGGGGRGDIVVVTGCDMDMGRTMGKAIGPEVPIGWLHVGLGGLEAPASGSMAMGIMGKSIGVSMGTGVGSGMASSCAAPISTVCAASDVDDDNTNTDVIGTGTGTAELEQLQPDRSSSVSTSTLDASTWNKPTRVNRDGSPSSIPPSSSTGDSSGWTSSYHYKKGSHHKPQLSPLWSSTSSSTHHHRLAHHPARTAPYSPSSLSSSATSSSLRCITIPGSPSALLPHNHHHHNSVVTNMNNTLNSNMSSSSASSSRPTGHHGTGASAAGASSGGGGNNNTIPTSCCSSTAADIIEPTTHMASIPTQVQGSNQQQSRLAASTLPQGQSSTVQQQLQEFYPIHNTPIQAMQQSHQFIHQARQQHQQPPQSQQLLPSLHLQHHHHNVLAAASHNVQLQQHAAHSHAHAQAQAQQLQHQLVLAAGVVPQHTEAPAFVDPTNTFPAAAANMSENVNPSDAFFAYCYDRGDGRVTRLIAADQLPALVDIPAQEQAIVGMRVLPLPNTPAPVGVAAPASTELVRFQGQPQSSIIATSPESTPGGALGLLGAGAAGAGGQPGKKTKIYCDKWVHEGVCAFTQQGCKYKHEMPYDKATQNALGLFHGLPTWYKKHQAELARSSQELVSGNPEAVAGGQASGGGGGGGPLVMGSRSLTLNSPTSAAASYTGLGGHGGISGLAHLQAQAQAQAQVQAQQQQQQTQQQQQQQAIVASAAAVRDPRLPWRRLDPAPVSFATPPVAAAADNNSSSQQHQASSSSSSLPAPPGLGPRPAVAAAASAAAARSAAAALLPTQQQQQHQHQQGLPGGRGGSAALTFGGPAVQFARPAREAPAAAAQHGGFGPIGGLPPASRQAQVQQPLGGGAGGSAITGASAGSSSVAAAARVTSANRFEHLSLETSSSGADDDEEEEEEEEGAGAIGGGGAELTRFE